MKIIPFLLMATILFSCFSPKNENEEIHADQDGSKKLAEESCFRYAGSSDTIKLNIIQNGNSVTGTLDYILKEKDTNKGTIEGSMDGNMLIADYTFMSEGMQSIRQVAFKLEGNSFVEGYGDIAVEGNKARFKNLDSLTFNTSMPLTKMNCH